jgi:hypothetical protein
VIRRASDTVVAVGPADSVFSAWSRHNRWLFFFGFGSVVAGTLYYVVSASPDGRDPFYVALAMQFVAWGALNTLFAWRGILETKRFRGDAPALLAKSVQIVRLLRLNRWLNALWLAMGVSLLASGYWVWSAGLAGHGVGILVQGFCLTIADEIFLRRLDQFDDR